MTDKIELTDRFIKALRPGTKTWDKHCGGKDRPIIWDAVVPGFAVRVSGIKCSYVLVKRFPGKKHPEPRSIGDVGAIAVADARNKARAWLELIGKGVDPKTKAAQDAAAERQRQADTFGTAFELFVTHHLSKLRTGKHVEQVMRRCLMPRWENKPITSITRRDVLDPVNDLHDGGSPISANRLVAYTKKFFKWCVVSRGILDVSPAALVAKPVKEESRDRVLSDPELRAIWKACADRGAFGRAVRFIICTAARRSEAGDLPWAEIDSGVKLWSLPSERAKNKRKLELPLNDLAIGCLGESGNGFVFSTDSGKTAINSWSKSKATLDAAALEELQKERPGAVLAQWGLHDLRRTVATNLGKLGVDRITQKKILNHVDKDVTAVYDRYDRDVEMVAAMEKWNKRLQIIVAGIALVEDAQRA